MTPEVFKQQLEALSADYRRRLPEKFAKLDNLWDALTSGSSTPARIVDLQRELHTLVGTAKTLGVPAVTETARAAETFLEPFCARCMIPGPTEQIEFCRLLKALKQSAAEP